jgi:hypothetical protein
LPLYRKQDFLRRASALKQQQEALAAEFAATLADGDDEHQNEILQMLQEEGLDDLFKTVKSSTPNQSSLSTLYDSAAGEIPPGILRSELERLLGLRPADDPDDPLARGLDFEGVENYARSIEQGTGSLQPPPEFWDAEPEPGEVFLQRLNKSVENFEEMFLNQKDQAKLRRERKAAGEIEDPDDSEDAFRSLLNDIPMYPDDYITNIPAPDIPEKAVAQFERAERVLLVLRRALLKDGFTPSAGIEALVAKDLTSLDSFYFEDPWLVVDKLQDALEYLEKMSGNAGIHLDVDTMFSSYYEYKPEVKCRIIIHTLMHVPLPSWYVSYLELHGQPAPPKDQGTKHRWQPGEAIQINLLKNEDDETEPIIPGVLFPREMKNSLGEEEQQQPSETARWLRWPHPIAAQRQVLVANPTWKRSNPKSNFEVVGSNLNFSSKKSPDYSLLHPAAALTGSGLLSSGWYSQQAVVDVSKSNVPPLPRPELIQPNDLEIDPLTPDEAEQLLRELLGNKFDNVAAQLPEKAQEAIVPADQYQELQIGATWSYEVDPETGKVSSVCMQWSQVGGPIADITHAFDIYLTECGLLV